ncbi:MAG: hypothetical protein PUI85_05790 [Eubacteriales bacterium]|nr:hypothetical protein [Eubacteriales bacterium]MDY3332799.1 hypothetical protein [Gallibacter sp.]
MVISTLVAITVNNMLPPFFYNDEDEKEKALDVFVDIYGIYQNIKLTDYEYEDLKAKYENLDIYINRLSVRKNINNDMNDDDYKNLLLIIKSEKND